MNEQEKANQDKNTDDSIEERVVNKLKKVITIKKELSEKQQQHLNKLAKAKAGKKYVEKVDVEDAELPVVEIPKKIRKPRVKPIEPETESSEEVVIVKKKKKRVVVVEESSEEEPVKKPVKKVVPKKKPVKKPVVKRQSPKTQQPEPQVRLSYFKKSIF